MVARKKDDGFRCMGGFYFVSYFVSVGTSGVGILCV